MTEIEDVNARGVGLAGVISALKPAFAKNPDLVPEELRSYMQLEVDPEGWYPLSVYYPMLKIVAGIMDPKKVKGDPYRAMGVIAARRDVFGDLANVPKDQQPQAVGLFQGALKGVTGLGTLVRRALALRERYYSRGYYALKRTGERTVEVTLENFPAAKELCMTSTGYLATVIRAGREGIWVERVSCKGEGHSDCRWELRFPKETDPKELSIFS